MSVQQLSNRHIAILTAALMQMYNTGYGPSLALDFETQEALKSYIMGEAHTSSRELFARLAELNAAAYNSRYPRDHAAPVPPLVDIEDFSLFFVTLFTGCPNRGDFVPAPGYYRTVKLLDSFVCQCSTDATRQTRLYQLLETISRQLKIFAFDYSPQYDKAPWTVPSWEQ